MSGCRFLRVTSPSPGAIAIFQLIGDVVPVLTALTGRRDWPVGRLRLVPFAEIDDGLAGRIKDDSAELMPHGGPRVVQRLAERLRELGLEAATPESVDSREKYPEARDDFEAIMLETLSRAVSPLAIDVLLDQPRRWPAVGRTARIVDPPRATRLDRLVDPPLVVLAGPPNVGKSTLSNTLLGRSMSIAFDRPGTTRDYTAGLIDLRSLVVSWHDTPGLAAPRDAIEKKAISLALGLMERATLLVAMTDAEHEWPELPRPADLRVAGKGDVRGRDDADVTVSAVSGAGLPKLAHLVRESLVRQSDLDDTGAWPFDPRLARLAADRSRLEDDRS